MQQVVVTRYRLIVQNPCDHRGHLGESLCPSAVCRRLSWTPIPDPVPPPREYPPKGALPPRQ
ncbi:hypothetical protein X801_07373, partial [Opisthorchis viverrini]